MDEPVSELDARLLVGYHIGEDLLIGLLCLAMVWRAYRLLRRPEAPLTAETGARVWLLAAGFAIHGASSLLHGAVHTAAWASNLLYQTLLGYCLGLLLIVSAVSLERPAGKKALALGYLPLLFLLLPSVHSRLPLFGELRPLVWISVAYLAGLISMLYLAAAYRTQDHRFLGLAGGFALLCIAASFLFFPAPIGSQAWLHGHLLRPVGFVVIVASLGQREMALHQGSILYRALTAFGLLAAVPLVSFGTAVFYESIRPVNILGQRLLLFLLFLVTVTATLVFGLGLIIRLVRPILLLKRSVAGLAASDLRARIPAAGNDEIGELGSAFNDMLTRLRLAMDEQQRLCQLAATGELAATLAHEIRNPLLAIDGAAEYIGKNFSGELVREFVGIIRSEATRIQRLTSALMTFAQPQELRLRAVDLGEVVRGTATLMGTEAREQRVTLETSLAADLPPALGDGDQIKQVLINLVLNALQAVAKGGQVHIGTGFREGMLAVTVADNGPGIPAALQGRIFHPFFTTKARGTGLGLAVSRNIARAHGGDLTVESAPGQGSTFTLLLRAVEKRP
ncbi:MAG: ATP-binding protein [Thermodesulfobacteriota bacterium]